MLHGMPKSIKKIALTCLIVISSLILLTNCKKEDVGCSDNVEFCAFINTGDFNATGPLINNFLSRLNNNQSDQEKLEQLIECLNCKSCVSNAQILCSFCIETNPPQSEIRIVFNVNGQQVTQTLDISMEQPLRFVSFHE